MKNIAIGILLIATLIFGGLYLRQTRETVQAKTNADKVRQQLSESQSSLGQQEEQATSLRRELESARANEAAKAINEKSSGNQPQGAAATAATAPKTNAFAEMFKNPEMKEMIKNQQKIVLGTIIDRNYGKLFSDLKLTSEQSAALKNLILNKQLDAATLGMSMVSGDMDAAKHADAVKQIQTANEATDSQIKELLGSDNYAQFQDYEKSMGERMAVSGFKDQLSGAAALTDDQEQSLIQAMTQERQNFKFTTDLSDKSKFTGDLASVFTEDKVNVYTQELGQLNQQYLVRAQNILSPDQLPVFEKYLATQQTMQKAGLQMAAKMFSH